MAELFDEANGARRALHDVVGDVRSFLEQVLLQVEEKLVRGRTIDHVCYRVETEEQYAQTKADLISIGSLLTESMIGGRPISMIKLDDPIVHGPYTIPCVELPSPKQGSAYKTGLEHIEVVIGRAEDGCTNSRPMLEAFAASHPEWDFDMRAIGKEINADVSVALKIDGALARPVSVKFHARPIEEVIAYERSQGLC